MLDIQWLRNDLAGVVARLAARGYTLDAAKFQTVEAERKAIQTRTQELQAKRNALSKQIGAAKGKGEDASALLAEVSGIGAELDALESQLADIQSGLRDWLLTMPNLAHASVPIGHSEAENVEVRRWGTPRTFDFPVRDHVDIGAVVGGLEFEISAKLSGARFYTLRGGVARLHRALTQMMLDTQTNEHGYTECYVPYVVNAATMTGTGQLPKFEDDLFWVTKGGAPDEARMYLVPTAEVPLTNFMRDAIVAGADLPLKLTAHTPSFRSEAGSYGKDTRGMIRVHQFDKVELVQIVHPERSYDALEEMTGHAEKILQKLELPYRVLTLVHRRHELRRRKDLRPRSMVARAGKVPRDLVLLELRSLSGAAAAGALPQRARQARAGPYAERFGPGGRTGPRRSHGELPARRRRDRCARRPEAVHGRRAQHRSAALSAPRPPCIVRYGPALSRAP